MAFSFTTQFRYLTGRRREEKKKKAKRNFQGKQYQKRIPCLGCTVPVAPTILRRLAAVATAEEEVEGTEETRRIEVEVVDMAVIVVVAVVVTEVVVVVEAAGKAIGAAPMLVVGI